MNSIMIRIGVPAILAVLLGGMFAWAGWAPLPEVQLAKFEDTNNSTDNSQQQNKMPGLDEFAAVWNKRLFNPKVEEPPPAQPVADAIPTESAEPELPPPEIPLALVQILFSEKARLAVFDEKSSRKRVRLVEDQVYGDLKLIRILPDGVMIEFAGRVVELSLKTGEVNTGGQR